jgi:hypothetical protein
MNSILPRRRFAEIKAKLQSLQKEIEHWEKLTNSENRGLRRHYSQVRRLGMVFDGLTESVDKEITLVPPDSESVLEKAASWENVILAAHSIWEVFRSKLILREDELFRNVLAACDDLAWACYRPAMAKFAPRGKQPPLVYFSATSSPFAVSRDSNFQNEVRTGPGTVGALSDEGFLNVLRRLPIPLISIPWYHAFHLPGALIIAHETGHVVEFDFGLTGAIANALDRAQLDHVEAWKSWASEVFADLYACLCLGPAFVAAMMDFLSASVKTVQTEVVRTRGKYPSRALRIELLLEALIEMGHRDDEARLRSVWEDVYEGMAATEYRADVLKVVKTLYSADDDRLALKSFPCFPTNADHELQTIAEAASDGYLGQTGYNHYHDPRLLFAAAQRVHENATGNTNRKAYGLIVEQVIRPHLNEFRGINGEPVENQASLEADLSFQMETDLQSGRYLRDYLLTLQAYLPPGDEPPDHQAL